MPNLKDRQKQRIKRQPKLLKESLRKADIDFAFEISDLNGQPRPHHAVRRLDELFSDIERREKSLDEARRLAEQLESEIHTGAPRGSETLNRGQQMAAAETRSQTNIDRRLKGMHRL